MKKYIVLMVLFLVILSTASVFAAKQPKLTYNNLKFTGPSTCIDACGKMPSAVNLEASKTYQLCISDCTPLNQDISTLFGVSGLYNVFLGIKNELTDINTRIDNIEFIPGPQGPIGPQGDPGICEVTQEMYDSLLARVIFLEDQIPSTYVEQGPPLNEQATQIGAPSDYRGMKFRTKSSFENIVLESVKFKATVPQSATTAYLLDSSKVLITSALLDGSLVATFNYALEPDTSYYMVFDGLHLWRQGGASYPLSRTIIDWTGIVTDSCDLTGNGLDLTSYYFSIEEMTFSGDIV